MRTDRPNELLWHLFDDEALGVTVDAQGHRRVRGLRGIAVAVDRLREEVLEEAYAERERREAEPE